MERMIVIAPKGKTCPKELSRELIGDTVETTVPNDHYYRSRISSGELVFKGHVGAPAVEQQLETVKKRGGAK
jgi:hypothetical protein